MKFSRFTKSTTIATMTLFMSHVPNLALAEGLVSSNQRMISTSFVLAEVSRGEAEKNIQDYISKSEVQSELMKHGISAAEVNSRLASLSESELRQLAGQVQEARAGGDILVTILVVVLIIFLIQRL